MRISDWSSDVCSSDLITAVVGFASIAAFATGWLWTGLLLMLFLGPLDGVDGKLARTRLQYSRWGDLEHVADKIVEYGAFIALGGYLSSTAGHSGPWVLAGKIGRATSEPQSLIRHSDA